MLLHLPMYFGARDMGYELSGMAVDNPVKAGMGFLLETALRRRSERADRLVEDPEPAPTSTPWPVRVLAMGRRPAVAAALVIAVAAPIDTAALSDNTQVILIEQGQVGKANAQ